MYSLAMCCMLPIALDCENIQQCAVSFLPVVMGCDDQHCCLLWAVMSSSVVCYGL